MARLIHDTTSVPFDLRTFDAARWIQDAIDHHDPFLAPRVRRLTRAEVFQDPFARRIVAPARYRRALRDAVGERGADAYFSALFGGRTP